MSRSSVKLFLFLFTLLVGGYSHAHQNPFGYTVLNKISSTEQVNEEVLNTKETFSINTLSYSLEKLNRILSDSFIEMEEEVKEEDHEDDDSISLNDFSSRSVFFASFTSIQTMPSHRHFSYSSSNRYLVFQVFRI